MKTLSKKDMASIKKEVKSLLHASRDCLRNRRVDTDIHAWHVNDSYYGEAFGVMRGLEALGYGYFGPGNVDGVADKKTKIHEQNLTWWFDQLGNEVLKEEHFGDPTKKCPKCKKKYGRG